MRVTKENIPDDDFDLANIDIIDLRKKVQHLNFIISFSIQLIVDSGPNLLPGHSSIYRFTEEKNCKIFRTCRPKVNCSYRAYNNS